MFLSCETIKPLAYAIQRPADGASIVKTLLMPAFKREWDETTELELRPTRSAAHASGWHDFE